MFLKPLLLLFSLVIIQSCASFNNPREIVSGKNDGLRFESLERYDKSRLQNSLKLQDPIALCHVGKFEEAHELLKTDLDNKIKDFTYWNKIATCYIIEKVYTRADYFLDLALSTAKSNKDKAVVLNNKGVVLLENEKFDAAKEYFKKSIELSKNYLTPRYNLAQIYLKYGILKKAGQQLDILLAKNSKDIDFLNSKAYLELMKNEYKNALVYFNFIPVEYRHRDDIATNLAMTYFMLGLYDNANKTLAGADKKDDFYTDRQAEIIKKIEKLTEKKL